MIGRQLDKQAVGITHVQRPAVAVVKDERGRRLVPGVGQPLGHLVLGVVVHLQCDVGERRLGLEGAKWSLTAWSKNLTDTKYNAEFSPGNVGGAGFLWRALPRRYGLTFDYRF